MVEDIRQNSAQRGDRSPKGLSVRGDSGTGSFRLGPNNGLIFEGRHGTDAVFGMRRGDVVKGTRRKPRNSGQG